MPKRTGKAAPGGKKPPAKPAKAIFIETNTKKTDKSTEKKSKESLGNTNSKGNSKMTLSSIPNSGIRQYRERRPGRPPGGKRLSATAVKEMPGKLRSAYRRSLDPCDNSNDSGLGFDHHTDAARHAISERLTWSSERAEPKRPKLDIKLEHDDINDSYNFPESIRTCKDNTALIRTAPSGPVPSLTMTNNQHSSSGRAVPRCMPIANRQPANPAVPLTSQLTASSRFMDVTLTIVKQPEQQHRARYQTEGSRGAVKDREGNGFPIVQLNGYYKPATLQVFIGTDVGKVSPHMFYQACKVSGKNSTPCTEKKVEGTCVIELQLDPSKEMSATCDCVGILKERNVDVEHRFPDQLGNRSKKKSTRCRMIFRTTLTLDDGTPETLQVCSQPIVCTQPPGIPEICKKSLTACPASGGLELFVLGKNFLKDTKVFFQLIDDDRHVRWEQAVAPDKEYLQQTHFVCVVPPFHRPDITEPVTVRLCVVSSGKTSESHPFSYTPVNGAMPSGPSAPQQAGPFFNKLWSAQISKREQDLGMMPPPDSSLVPLSTRRGSISIPSTSEHSPPHLHTLKQEYIDENSQNSVMDAMEIEERYRRISESSMDVNHDSNMSLMNENSMDRMRCNGDFHNDSMSSLNENSMDVNMRKNSLGARSQICENSMDVNINSMNDDSSCSTAVMHCSNSVVTDRMTMTMPPQTLLGTTVPSLGVSASVDELKVMDLRMKLPMATVADLASTNAPSMATLQNFGVTEALGGPLPSAQSVNDFLTTIESKPMSIKDKMAQKMLHPQVIPTPCASSMLPATTESLSQLGISRSVTKNDIAVATTTLDNLVNSERLDALVNSTVESMRMPISTETIKDVLMSSKIELNTSLPLPPIITAQQGSPNASMVSPEGSVVLSPEVIMNTQLSPSLMCRNTQESIVPSSNIFCQTMAPPSVLLEAAADLLKSSPEMLSPRSTENIPVPVKELQMTQAQNGNATGDKKNDMITQGLTALSDNDLINFINPRCFDTGNANQYQ